jgi:hypothetical protein|tara:strand:+ start:101 stop:520 length:420 start_codon:yes stop_codon:yes gene_type:complete
MEFIQLTQDQLKNKLFCTFSPKSKLEEVLDTIKSEYVIMYDKIFVLESEDSDEFLCTYNIEVQSTNTRVLPNTILLHRKKETNTLYTINSLNLLIKSLNEGILDTSFRVEWQNYRNTVLLTQGDDLRKLSTKIHKIVTI